MLQSLGEDAKGESLHPGYGIRLRDAVGHNARHRADFGDPAAVDFLLKFDGESHEITPS